MKKFSFFLIFLCFSFSKTFSQESFTLSGYISDQRNGENIIGVNVYCLDLKKGVTSNTCLLYTSDAADD